MKKILNVRVLLTIIMLSGLILLVTVSNSEEILKGKEAYSQIIINDGVIEAGVDYSLVIPPPTNQLYEDSLISNSLYTGYTQSNASLPILGPKNIETFSDNRVLLAYTAIEKMDNGNYLFGVKKQQITNRAGVAFVEVDKSTGKVVKYLDERITNPDRSSSLLTKVSGNTYMGLYSTIGVRGSVQINLDDANQVITKESITDIDYSNQRKVHDWIATSNKIGDKVQLLSIVTPSNPNGWKMATVYLDVKTKEVTKGKDLNSRTPSQVFGGGVLNHQGVMGNTNPLKQSYSLSQGAEILQLNYTTNYGPTAPVARVASTIQVFDKDGQEEFYYKSEEKQNTSRTDFIDPQFGISNEDEYYFVEELNSKTYLKRYIVAEKRIEIVKEYPASTQLTIQNNLDGTYSYYGYTPSMTGEFQGFIQEGVASSNFVMGFMDGDFNILSCKTYPNNGPSKFEQVYPIGNDEYMIFGSSRATNFSNYPFNGVAGEDAWASQDTGNLIFGIIGTVKDFAPAIIGKSDIVVDLSDPDINKPGVLDNWLITGEKNGTENSEYAIKVYDSKDSGNNYLGNKWLYERINRNYLNPKLAIDWKALGFDNTNYGPQEVSYFISDSQKQISSMKRWINRVDEYTAYDDKAALGARNFDININDVEQLVIDSDENNQNNVINKGKVRAWKFDHAFEETYDLTKVAVNQEQLSVIKKARERYDLLADNPDKSSVLKPYPLKFTYTYDSGKTLIRDINVFVTDDQTTVTPQKIMYAYDYSLGTPIENALETPLKAYQHSKVTVYDYKTANILGNAGKLMGLSVDSQELADLKVELLIKKMPLTFTFTDAVSVISNEIEVSLRPEKQDITVNFTDEEGEELNSPLVIKGELIGSKYNLTTNQTVQDLVDSIIDTWYEVQRPQKETEIEVEKTGAEVSYVFKGLIGFKSVTGKMTFEKGYIYPFSQTLEYKSSEDFLIKILDNRGTSAPSQNYQRGQFSVNATLTVPFTNKGAIVNKILTDAELVYNDGTGDHVIDSSGISVYGSTTKTNERNFTIKLDEHGDLSSKGLSLRIPTGTGLELGKYDAEITWDLIQGP